MPSTWEAPRECSLEEEKNKLRGAPLNWVDTFSWHAVNRASWMYGQYVLVSVAEHDPSDHVCFGVIALGFSSHFHPCAVPWKQDIILDTEGGGLPQIW